MIKRTTFILLLAFLQLSGYAQRSYTLDVKKSKLLWKMETIGKHDGHIFFKAGSLSYTSQNMPSAGLFTLDMNTMRSLDGDASTLKRVNANLRHEDFFDVANHPLSTIMVKQLIPTKIAGRFKVIASLTIKGITNLVEFETVLKESGRTLNATAQINIDRREWNINYKAKPTSIFGSLKDKMMTNDIQVTLDLLFHY
jgi:polyisoprenoid-binding protein YceI